MLRNDYRRALILLRPLAGNWSGHVRLERRTLMGNMQLSVYGQVAEERLLAMLIGVKNGRPQIFVLTELKSGGRGRAAARCEFDPRNMDGLTLEQYDLVAVAKRSEGAWHLAMAGYPNGSRRIDWESVHRAVEALDRNDPSPDTQEPSQDMEQLPLTDSEKPLPDTEQPLPDTEQPLPDTEQPLPDTVHLMGTEAEVPPTKEPVLACPLSPADPASPQEAVLQEPVSAEWSDPDETETPAGAAPSSEEDVPSASPPEEDAPSASPSDDGASAAAPTKDGTETTPSGGGTSAAALTEEETAVLPSAEDLDIPADTPSAAEALELDGGDWPDSVAPLRPLFEEKPPVSGPDPNFVFVETEMPEGAVVPCTKVGLRSEGGRIVEVMYAVAAPFSEEPPEGMEEYVWRDNGWVFRRNVWQ